MAAAAVLLAHAGAYVSLAEFESPSAAFARGESDAILIEIDTGLPPPPPPEPQFEPPVLKVPPVALELPEFTGLNDPPGSADWLADGAQAAAAVGGLDGASVRSFGAPERPPEKPRKKPFGWEKSHTQRVEVMPGIGVRIRLSEHCDLLVSLIPMAGCSIGKIPARGDLFDGMHAPVEMGDWKDSPTVRN